MTVVMKTPEKLMNVNVKKTWNVVFYDPTFISKDCKLYAQLMWTTATACELYE